MERVGAVLSTAVATLLSVLLAVPVGALPQPQPQDQAEREDLTARVDPFIGSFAPGFTNPGPVLPHGMVGLGPDTAEGPLNYGGYYTTNALITGFSHTHMSAGVFHGGHIPVMPVVGEVDTTAWSNPAGAPVPAYASPFDRAGEVAEPGYYATTLLRSGIRAELTATTRTGLHRYRFPDTSAAADRHVVIDVSRTLRGLHEGAVTLREDGRTVTGVVHTDVSGPMPVFFAAEVDEAVEWSLFDGTALAPGTTAVGGGRFGLVATPTAPDAAAVLLVRVGISYTDEAGALANLRAEQPDFDFERTRAAADMTWEQALARIVVTSDNPLDVTRFTTALYHAQLFPNLHSDVDGRYRGPDQQVHTDAQRPRYSQFSLWDSYRGQNALLAVIDPEAYADMLVSLADWADLNGGVLPRWQLGPNNPGYMSGDPVIPFVGEGWCRGLVDEDLAARLMAQMHRLRERRDPALAASGYLPTPQAPLPAQVEGGGRDAGTTLEYGVADFSLALMADDHALAEVSTYYRTLLDPETGFIRPRDASGAWLEEFAPENGYGFQEGTSWQYSWLAAHDLGGLMEGMAASESALSPEDKLDVLFNLPASGTVPVVWPKVQNQATVFGVAYYGNQFAPGNEHDLQAPFAYTWLGVPWKTQAATRGAISVFTPTHDGLPGNDDLGALSGWLVWAMLGLAPTVPGAPGYVIASPMFSEVVVQRPGQADLVITAEGASAANRFVQSAHLVRADTPAPQAWESTWLLESDLRGDVELRFVMGAAPSTWASGTRPPSVAHDDLSAWGCAAG